MLGNLTKPNCLNISGVVMYNVDVEEHYHDINNLDTELKVFKHDHLEFTKISNRELFTI